MFGAGDELEGKPLALASQVPPAGAPAVAASWSRVAPASGRLGVITTARVEQRCWLTARARLVNALASGADGERARSAAEHLAADGAAGLVSFGLASGLAPVARPGDLVVAESVVLPSGASIRSDDAWRRSLLGQLTASAPKIHVARVLGVDRPAITVAAKKEAFRATFAAALDTESHAVAEVAAARGLPFVVVRAIVDPVERPRPAIALAGIGVAGEPRHLVVASRCLRAPLELVAFLRHRRLARIALRALAPVPNRFPIPGATRAA